MLFLAAQLLAQTAPAPCVAMDANLPASYAGWAAIGQLFTPGKAVGLKVDGGTASMAFHISTAGVYGIALGEKGWIDVIPASGGEALKSVSHREGDSCWSIRKIVRFQLAPGDYQLSLSKLAPGTAKVMLIAGE